MAEIKPDLAAIVQKVGKFDARAPMVTEKSWSPKTREAVQKLANRKDELHTQFAQKAKASREFMDALGAQVGKKTPDQPDEGPVKFYEKQRIGDQRGQMTGEFVEKKKIVKLLNHPEDWNKRWGGGVPADLTQGSGLQRRNGGFIPEFTFLSSLTAEQDAINRLDTAPPSEEIGHIDISETPYRGDINKLQQEYFPEGKYLATTDGDEYVRNMAGRTILLFEKKGEGGFTSVYSPLSADRLRQRLEHVPDDQREELLKLFKLDENKT